MKTLEVKKWKKSGLFSKKDSQKYWSRLIIKSLKNLSTSEHDKLKYTFNYFYNKIYFSIYPKKL